MGDYNVTVADFAGKNRICMTDTLYQYDYGQKLQIDNIPALPQTYEAHFSNVQHGGVSITVTGMDGIVDIPNALLMTGKRIYCWIYVTEPGSGETEYQVLMPVQARPMPEYYDVTDTGAFDSVVQQVGEYAATATAGATNATASAAAAATSASEAAASASAAQTAQEAAETAQGKAEDAQAAAETAAQTATEKAQQTEQDAAQAALDAGRAESAAQRAEAAETGAESAKTDAETAAQGAADSTSAASASATSAGQSATSAGQSASAAAGSATTAGNAAQTATTKAGEASASADAAAASETAAQTARTAAETAATNAGQSASTATTKAAEAAQSASNAAASETAAEAAATRAEQAAASLVVDDALSDTSENPVQNKVITGEVTQVKNAIDADENLLLDISYEPVTETITPTMTSGLCKADGSISASSNYEYTNIIPVTPGDVIRGKAIVKSGATAPTEPCYIRYWTAYSNDTVMPNAGTDSGQVREYTVPNGINGVRLTLNLGLYESGSLSVIRHTSVENKSVKSELITTDEDIVAAITVEKIGLNLIDKTIAETGALQQDGSMDTAGSWGNYKTSDYIPVKAGQTYRLYLADESGQSTSTTRIICGVFDSAKSLLTYSNNAGISYHDITPSVDGFVRVCCVDNPITYFTNNLMLIHGTDPEPYENYEVTAVLKDSISPVNAKLLNFSKGNILLGKKWCPCGDSFTYYTNKQFDSGKYEGKNQTYPYLIALRNDMKIESAFFNSGRTLAYPADHTFSNSLTCPTIPGYYQNIPEDADYITIMLGINDSQHTGGGSTGDGEDATGVITLGTINDNTTATYYGAWNVVLGWLRENRPFAHVGIIVTNGITANGDWKAAQIAIAKKWGYPLLDLNGDEKTPAMIRCYNPNVSDAVKEILRQKQAVDYDGSITGSVNTHPNWQAHEYESAFIEAWLRSL